MINYYSILGLSESASGSEIKAAFKKLAVKYHPDKNPDTPEMEERFKEVNEAYQILSNPYEKARYDLKLQYTYYTPETTYHAPDYHPTRSKPRSRPSYTEPKINWRENWVATAYAFGFTFIIACLAMIVIGIKGYVDEKNLEERQALRRATFEAAKTAFNNGEVEPALQKLNALGEFGYQEVDMADYKISLYESFIFLGESNFNKKNFNDAIYYYELIEKFAPFKPISLKEHLAEAYRKTNQPNKSIKLMKELLIIGQSPLTLFLAIGEIYRDDLDDPLESLRYFKLADLTAINQYKSYYGEAYGLLVNARALPTTHYQVYYGLADLYLRLDSAEKAIKVTNWNLKLWPDSLSNYLIAAKGHEKLGDKERACDLYKKAKKLGHTATPWFCQ